MNPQLPLIEEIKAPPDPACLYWALTGGEKYSFLLESAYFHPRWGRYSFLGANPFLVIKTKGREAHILTPTHKQRVKGSPWEIIRRVIKSYSLPYKPQPIPFIGGAVGYLGYDMGRYIEKLPSWALDDLPFPESYLAFYDTVLAVDHQEGRVFISSCGWHPSGCFREKEALERMAEVKSRLKNVCPLREGKKNVGVKPQVSSHFTLESYCRAVEKAQAYIAAGDIFEVNLSQRLEAPLHLHPWELYLRLRRVNPAPFAAYLPLEEGTVVSSSPERFLKISQGEVETRPIKGTRPRGRTPEEDKALREELYHSEKDRAELVMVVDLERNDLGKVCQTGSVRVPQLFTLEEYATVFHLVGTVTGTLRSDKDMVDLWLATFPGGSITGAPKVRSMEIIEELEPVRRSVYTGSIGYLGFDGEGDWNIVIRTFLLADRRAYFQVGGAVTADSVPRKEYQETWDKARGLLLALWG